MSRPEHIELAKEVVQSIFNGLKTQEKLVANHREIRLKLIPIMHALLKDKELTDEQIEIHILAVLDLIPDSVKPTLLGGLLERVNQFLVREEAGLLQVKMTADEEEGEAYAVDDFVQDDDSHLTVDDIQEIRDEYVKLLDHIEFEILRWLREGFQVHLKNFIEFSSQHGKRLEMAKFIQEEVSVFLVQNKRSELDTGDILANYRKLIVKLHQHMQNELIDNASLRKSIVNFIHQRLIIPTDKYSEFLAIVETLEKLADEESKLLPPKHIF